MNALFLFPNTRLYKWVILSFFIISLTLGYQGYKNALGEFRVHVFDISGESIFLQLPEGHKILIDGGTESIISEKIASHVPFWEREIDALFITHPDKDHLEGVLSVLDGFFVKNIFLSGSNSNSHLYKSLLQSVKTKNINITPLYSEKDILIGNTLFDTLFPYTSTVGKNIKKENNNSLVFRLSNTITSFLFTGDIEKETEEKILTTPVKIKSKILKVAHHGSKSSSTKDFIIGVSPKKAVISAHKDNPYNHPHPEILKRFNNLFIPIYTTKQLGNISFL